MTSFGGEMATQGRQVVQPGPGREPLGPYSVAVRGGGFVFVSGQLGWDAKAGGLVPGGIEAETRKTLENLEGVLADAGLGVGDVVKVTVLLADIVDWPTVNAIYAQVFHTEPPARAAYAVAALPAGARIEVEAVALDR